jgi:glycosyltransferase involved in cell wall biosynthesis
VTTWVSGIPELVTDGVDGVLVAPDDPAALRHALRQLATDPVRRADLAAAGRRTVADRFNGDVLAQELARLMAVAP